MKTSGLNDNLIELIGSNVTDFSDLSRRAGLYQLQSKYMYNFIHNKFIEWMSIFSESKADLDNYDSGIVKSQTFEYSSNILTMDDYMIDT